MLAVAVRLATIRVVISPLRFDLTVIRRLTGNLLVVGPTFPSVAVNLKRVTPLTVGLPI